MGGSVDRVKVLPLARGTLQEFTQQMGMFDCRDASCFIAEDRELLLGVTEAGFGTLDAFNSAAQSMLVSRAALLASRKVQRSSEACPGRSGRLLGSEACTSAHDVELGGALTEN